MIHTKAKEHARGTPTILYKSVEKSNIPSKTTQNSPREDVSKKIKLLKEIGFSAFETGHLSVSPRICLTDFTGGSEAFLRKAGYWEAFQKLESRNKIAKVHANNQLSKPGKPYLMDLNLERKLIFDQQRKSHANAIVKPKKKKLILPDYAERIEELNKILGENIAGNFKIHLASPLRKDSLKNKYHSLPSLKKQFKKNKIG